MANFAQIKKDEKVFDPFFGTGSLMLAASYFKTFILGADMDIWVLQGYGVGRLNKNTN